MVEKDSAGKAAKNHGLEGMAGFKGGKRGILGWPRGFASLKVAHAPGFAPGRGRRAGPFDPAAEWSNSNIRPPSRQALCECWKLKDHSQI